tara:strand:+ start:3406 stop:3660 length:255 start_codon:yes stop_codon:yes gene_type:complete
MQLEIENKNESQEPIKSKRGRKPIGTEEERRIRRNESKKAYHERNKDWYKSIAREYVRRPEVIQRRHDAYIARKLLKIEQQMEI